MRKNRDIMQGRAVAGAQVSPDGVTYRVWAPGHLQMSVAVEREGLLYRLVLDRDENGYWSGTDHAGRAGDLYRFELADGRFRPDVASRFQPRGVHGPSECIDPSTYAWRCESWVRPGWHGQSIYEIHLGTFTAEGTYRGAISRLAHLRDLGVEAIELMPLADFAGLHNWGYDGAALYAPARCYGRPDDLRALVDAAHDHGLAVILDVVYNHAGPAGNYLADYCPDYFHRSEKTPWGNSYDLDGPRSRPVRDFLLGNALYWLDEFRIDGLRLDAVHAIPDRSKRHLLDEISEAVHARGGFLVAEDERNEARHLHGPAGPSARFDAVWSDDFHHQVRVALTGIQSAYFGGYTGTTAMLAETLTHGWSYRGQSYAPWDGRHRGSDCVHLPTSAFVFCIENHDQVGNRAEGERLEQLVTPREFRAASGLLCLSPYVPLLFMGQEWAASTPFLYFTDHGGELGRQISQGRQREFAHHEGNWSTEGGPDPEAPATFARSKLRWAESVEDSHAAVLAFYRECLRQRRAYLRGTVLERARWRIHHLGEFVAVHYHGTDDARLLLVSLRESSLSPNSLPAVLNPPEGSVWRPVLYSEEKRFGGGEELPPAHDWKITGPAALWLEAIPEATHHGPR